MEPELIEEQLLEAALFAVDQQLTSSQGAAPTEGEPTEVSIQFVTKEVVFLDTSVEDYQQLLNDLWANEDSSRQLDVVFVEPILSKSLLDSTEHNRGFALDLCRALVTQLGPSSIRTRIASQLLGSGSQV